MRSAACQTEDVAPRFLLLPDVAETLNISVKQARTLVVSGDLPAIQVGGRGQWRIEASELEAYIQRMYAQTRAKVEARAFGRDGENGDDDEDDDVPVRSRAALGSGPHADDEHGLRP